MKQATERLYQYLLVAVAVTLPLGIKLNNVAIAALLVTAGASFFTRRPFATPARKREFLLSLGIYFLFVTGLLWTQDLRQGFKELEHKLPLLLFPVILLTHQTISKGQVRRALLGFAYSCLACSVYLLVMAAANYLQTQNLTHFFYHDFSRPLGIHAVYLSAYLVFASFIFLEQLSKPQTGNPRVRLLQGAGVVLLTATIFLLSSKTITAVYVALVVLFTFRHFTRKRQTSFGIMLSSGLMLAVLVTILSVPNIRTRAQEVMDSKFSVLQQERFQYDTKFSGLTLRLLFWKFAVEIIDREDAWLGGVGPGDSQYHLNNIYREYNLYTGNQNNINPLTGQVDIGYLDYDTHSQYVETFLKVGLVGLLFLVVYLGRNLWQAITRKELLYTAFLTIFIAFSFTESTLQTNKGIVFFAFFNSLFLAYLTSGHKKPSE
ncbi:O-antigen ligase family protein [Rufibacter psychrotolerans]|uniref:O-antigen ligase family protein n=1 Tax=Rufibacter psychrotolerans TaxID=2812556 RepID=UPI00196761C4|nr:O-antigen ligase family protein [Rufibacter sp. SYSU D00308]